LPPPGQYKYEFITKQAGFISAKQKPGELPGVLFAFAVKPFVSNGASTKVFLVTFFHTGNLVADGTHCIYRHCTSDRNSSPCRGVF
jgi:hypothetical protein